MIMQMGQNTLNTFHQPALSPAARRTIYRTDSADKVKELQLRQQQLQNTMLLMKASGSDSSSMPEETQKVLEKEMDQVSLDLRAAKAEELKMGKPDAVLRPHTDVYEKESLHTASPGIYQMAGNKNGYEISFLPYKEP